MIARISSASIQAFKEKLQSELSNNGTALKGMVKKAKRAYESFMAAKSAVSMPKSQSEMLARDNYNLSKRFADVKSKLSKDVKEYNKILKAQKMAKESQGALKLELSEAYDLAEKYIDAKSKIDQKISDAESEVKDLEDKLASDTEAANEVKAKSKVDQKVSDAVSKGREVVSGAVSKGREVVSGAVSKGKRKIKNAAAKLKNATTEPEQKGIANAESKGVKPEEVKEDTSIKTNEKKLPIDEQVFQVLNLRKSKARLESLKSQVEELKKQALEKLPERFKSEFSRDQDIRDDIQLVIRDVELTSNVLEGRRKALKKEIRILFNEKKDLQSQLESLSKSSEKVNAELKVKLSKLSEEEVKAKSLIEGLYLRLFPNQKLSGRDFDRIGYELRIINPDAPKKAAPEAGDFWADQAGHYERLAREMPGASNNREDTGVRQVSSKSDNKVLNRVKETLQSIWQRLLNILNMIKARIEGLRA